MAPDSRRLPRIWNSTCLESVEPSSDGLPKRLNFEPAMNFRETVELEEPCLKQVPRPQ